MNDLTQPLATFDYNGQIVRTIMRDGEPWFVAADVCEVLEIGNPTMAIARLDDDETTLISIEGASNRLPVNAVNEPGLYALVLGSRKPEAKLFKRWIVHEVLPRIRKTGMYIAVQVPDRVTGLITVADSTLQVVKIHEQAISALQADVTQLARRVDNQITVTAGQRLALRKAIAQRVSEIEPDHDQWAVRYSGIYRVLHEVFGVPSYHDIPRRDFEQAMAVVRRYAGGATERAS